MPPASAAAPVRHAVDQHVDRVHRHVLRRSLLHVDDTAAPGCVG